MKFSISVADFQYAMRIVKDVVPTSGPLAESVGVLIEARGSRAVFTAFNPEVMAKATVKISSDRDGDAVVDAPALYSAISHFKPQNDRGVGTTDITVVSSPRSRKLQITAKTRYATGSEIPHKRVFALRNQEFFPSVPSVDRAELSFELPARTLMDGIDSVSFATSNDSHQLIFTGVLFQLEKDKLTLFATNGVCLAEYSSPVNYEGDPVRLVLPSSFTGKVSKSFFDDDILQVMITRSMMFVRTANLILGGALIREEYPDYKKVLTAPENFAVLDKHVLLDNLLNMSYEAATIDNSRVSLSLEDSGASLACGASLNAGIPAEFSGKFSVDCNLSLLANSIRNLYGDQMRLGFTDSSSPLHLLSTDPSPAGSTLNCVLVPLS